MKRTLLLSLLILFSGFARGGPGKIIRGLQIPPGVKSTILLVENFEDTYAGSAGVDSTNYKNHDFPAIAKRNSALHEENEKLQETFKKYKYDYTLSGLSTITASADMSDKTRFRFILKRKPETHTNISKNGDTSTEDVYILYFNDRLTGTDYPGIEVNIKDYPKTMEAIVRRLNKIGR